MKTGNMERAMFCRQGWRRAAQRKFYQALPVKFRLSATHGRVAESYSLKVQEKRLSRLEALVSQTQELLAEIRGDVKILLRGGQQ